VINNLNTFVIAFVILDLYIFSHFRNVTPIRKLMKNTASGGFTIGIRITYKQGF